MQILLTVSLAALLFQATTAGTESPHRRGPHGLQGWTINYPIPNYDSMPRTLVIAHGGHILHRVEGRPLIFTWMFQDDGARVAYSTGPLHFEELCVLIDTATGKELANYDCFHDPAGAAAPAWVKLLEQRELGH